MGMSIKPHLGLVLIPLAANRFFPKRVLICCVAGIAGTSIASMLYAGAENCLDYVLKALPTLSSGYAFYPNKSMNGLLLRLFSDEDPAVYNLVKPVPWIKAVSLIFWLCMLLLATYVSRIQRRVSVQEDSVLCCVFAITAVVVASPICWEHHLAALVIPFCVVVNRLWGQPWLRSRVLDGLLFSSILLVGTFFHAEHLSGFPKALFSGLEFYGALLFLGCLFWLMLSRNASPSDQHV
jgi:hypothetical protein